MAVDLRRAVAGRRVRRRALERCHAPRARSAARHQGVDIYGLSEILGPGVACECHAAQAGLHGWEDHFLFEVIDPETLQPLPMAKPASW